MSDVNDFLRMPNWYPVLAGHTFLTSFVKMRSDVIAALAAGETGEHDKSAAVASILEDLRQPLGAIPGNLIQAVGGIVISVVVMELVKNNRAIARLMND